MGIEGYPRPAQESDCGRRLLVGERICNAISGGVIDDPVQIYRAGMRAVSMP